MQTNVTQNEQLSPKKKKKTATHLQFAYVNDFQFNPHS